MRFGPAFAALRGSRISTQHLELTTFPSDSTVAPGNRFSVALEITPHAGMHVYAPGAKGYRVISLTIDPNQYIRALPMTYPPSEIYEFKPLNERVPTYQKPFALVQELMLDGQGSTRTALRDQTSLTITGTLNYQACDDRLCSRTHSPQSV